MEICLKKAEEKFFKGKQFLVLTTGKKRLENIIKSLGGRIVSKPSSDTIIIADESYLNKPYNLLSERAKDALALKCTRVSADFCELMPKA